MTETAIQHFLLPIGGDALLFAPLHRFSAVVNGSAARRLRADFATNVERLFGEWSGELATHLAPPAPPSGDIDPSFLALITTRACNIGCHYCNFASGHAAREEMSLEIAVRAVDWYLGRLLANNRDQFRIHFFGGEPFLAQDVVETVVHRTRRLAGEHGLRTHFDASTNGIMGQRMREFVAHYFDSIVLSFDGLARHHDRNRPGKRGQPTFDLVSATAAYMRDKPVEVCIRLCVTNESVGELEETTRWMCEEFQPGVINFETLTPGDLAEQANLHPPDPYLFAGACVRAARIARSLGVSATYSAADTTRPRRSFCGVGTDAAIVSLDGRVSGCYLMPEEWGRRGMDLDMGTLADAAGSGLDPDRIARVREAPSHKPRCDGCFCRWTCAGGCHVNQTYPESPTAYTDFCVQTRLITACFLLEEMGMPDRVDALLNDPAACETLALHAFDAVPL